MVIIFSPVQFSIFDHYLFSSITEEKQSTIWNFDEERKKLYEESLANSKASVTSTSLPNQDIKASLKDLSNTKRVHQEEATRQTGTLKTHILGTIGRVQKDDLFK